MFQAIIMYVTTNFSCKIPNESVVFHEYSPEMKVICRPNIPCSRDAQGTRSLVSSPQFSVKDLVAGYPANAETVDPYNCVLHYDRHKRSAPTT